MNKMIYIAEGIQKLTGGNYSKEQLIELITKVREWTVGFGLGLAGVALIVGFVMYSIVSVEQKPKIKQGIIQTLLGIVGIILAVSLINIIIDLFAGVS